MAIQLGDAVRNARNDSIETSIGATAKLQLRTGAPPATPATADSGTLLAELTLPSDWMNASAGGVKTLLGTWAGVGVAAGNAGHFRLKNNAATVTGMQGTVTATGGGGDMTLDNVAIAVAQAVTITGFTLTDGNP
jgi:hypothetical protein